MQVENHHVGAEAVERLETGLRRLGPPHLVADSIEVIPHGTQHVGVVVDQENAVRHAPSRAAPCGDPRSRAGRPAATGPRTARRPPARRRAASAGAGPRATPRAPSGRARTRAAARHYAAAATARRTR